MCTYVHGFYLVVSMCYTLIKIISTVIMAIISNTYFFFTYLSNEIIIWILTCSNRSSNDVNSLSFKILLIVFQCIKFNSVPHLVPIFKYFFNEIHTRYEINVQVRIFTISVTFNNEKTLI